MRFQMTRITLFMDIFATMRALLFLEGALLPIRVLQAMEAFVLIETSSVELFLTERAHAPGFQSWLVISLSA